MPQKTYHIFIIGCQMNHSDSERFATYLESYGYAWVKSPYEADLVVLTTCGVRQTAEDRIYMLAPKIKKANKKCKIILTGCLSERTDVRERLDKHIDCWLNINDLPKLSEKIDLGEKMTSYKDYLNIAPKYESDYTAYVPIGNGCNNFCTYCVVPYARGREVYRPAQEILNEVRDLVSLGFKEIIVIAQNVNSYSSHNAQRTTHNKDGEIKFPELLRKINDIPGDFWIRFSTSHPKDMSDDLINAIAECDKVCEHVHLPAQAGNNEILAAMNRKYKIEDYKDLLNKIRTVVNSKKELPVAITTDIIVGFPGETAEQYNDTAKLFEEMKYDMAYTAQYSVRFGTAASKLVDDVTSEEKHRRETDLNNILRRTGLENNQWYKDKEVDVLVDERRKSGEYFGKTRTFKTVRFDSPATDLVGKFVRVKIDKASDFGLNGTIM